MGSSSVEKHYEFGDQNHTSKKSTKNMSHGPYFSRYASRENHKDTHHISILIKSLMKNKPHAPSAKMTREEIKKHADMVQ